MSDRYLRSGIFLAPFHDLPENPTLALERDMELLQLLDRLNYHEAWIGEHHSGGFEIIDSPEIFIAAAAERTRHIRLGTGVVSLPYPQSVPLVAGRIVQHRSHDARPGRCWGSVRGRWCMVRDEDRHQAGRSAPAAMKVRPLDAADRRACWTARPPSRARASWFRRLQDARLQLLLLHASADGAGGGRVALADQGRWRRAGTASACCRSAAPAPRRWPSTRRTGRCIGEEQGAAERQDSLIAPTGGWSP